MKINYTALIEANRDAIIEAMKEADRKAYNRQDMQYEVYIWNDGEITTHEYPCSAFEGEAMLTTGECILLNTFCHANEDIASNYYANAHELCNDFRLDYDAILPELQGDMGDDYEPSFDEFERYIKENYPTEYEQMIGSIIESYIDTAADEANLYDEIIDDTIADLKYTNHTTQEEHTMSTVKNYDCTDGATADTYTIEIALIQTPEGDLVCEADPISTCGDVIARATATVDDLDAVEDVECYEASTLEMLRVAMIRDNLVGQYYILKDLDGYGSEEPKCVDKAEAERLCKAGWGLFDDIWDVATAEDLAVYGIYDPVDNSLEKTWYAIEYDEDDNDWGYGFDDYASAVKELRRCAEGHPDARIAVIKIDRNDAICDHIITLDDIGEEDN